MSVTKDVKYIIENSPKKFNGIPLGALPSPEDKRDYRYDIVASFTTSSIPVKQCKTTYRANMPNPFNQGSLGTCVAAASCWGFKAFQEISEGYFPVQGLSTAYLYAKCKNMDGIPNEMGTYPRVAMKILKNFGVCSEESLPYNWLTRDTLVPEPSTNLNEQAKKFRIKSYAQVCGPEDTNMDARISTLRNAIINEGPVLGSAIIAENFANLEAPNYIVPHPEGRLLGGHALCFCDIDDTRELFTVRNTWGEQWADNGYCYLPYRLLAKTFSYDGVHPIPYITEVWTAPDLIVPREAKTIVLEIGSKVALVNGEEIQLDQPPAIANDRTLVPIRFVGGNMGLLVHYANGEITLAKPDGSLAIKFTINKAEVTINNVTRYLNQPPTLDETTNRTLVPIRTIAEAVGYTVAWNETFRIVTLTKNN